MYSIEIKLVKEDFMDSLGSGIQIINGCQADFIFKKLQ